MMCHTFARVTAVVLVLLGALLGPGSLLSPSQVEAQVISDYTAFPPFITNVTIPNILIIMDNSGSMEGRACDPSACGVLPDGTTSTVQTFVNTTLYTGFFDSMKCYDYLAAGKAVVSTPVPSARRLSSVVRIAEGAEAFISAIEAALRDSRDAVERRLAAAAPYTWDRRVEEKSRLIRWRLGEREGREVPSIAGRSA